MGYFSRRVQLPASIAQKRTAGEVLALLADVAAMPSELGHPGEGREDPHLPRAEVDDHRIVTLDLDNPAEPILIVGHLIENLVLLDGRRLHVRGIEGT